MPTCRNTCIHNWHFQDSRDMVYEWYFLKKFIKCAVCLNFYSTGEAFSFFKKWHIYLLCLRGDKSKAIYFGIALGSVLETGIYRQVQSSNIHSGGNSIPIAGWEAPTLSHPVAPFRKTSSTNSQHCPTLELLKTVFPVARNSTVVPCSLIHSFPFHSFTYS